MSRSKEYCRIQEAASLSDLHRLEPACWVAHIRASSKLIKDRLAVQLAGQEGPQLSAQFSMLGANFMNDIVELRTVYVDHVVQDFAEAGGRQIVILGAGMDTRAWRLMKLHSRGMTVFELDEQPILDVKRERLGKEVIAKTLCRRVEVPKDFGDDDWDEALLDKGFDKSQRSLFILEGVSMYMTESAFDQTLKKIAALSAPDSVIVGDWVPRLTVQNKVPGPAQEILRVFARDYDRPWLFGPRNEKVFNKMLAQVGFSTVEQLTSKGLEREVNEICPSPYRPTFEVRPKKISLGAYVVWALCTYGPARICAGAPADIGLRVYMATFE